MQLQNRAQCRSAVNKQRAVASVKVTASPARPVTRSFAAPVKKGANLFQRQIEARAAETVGKASTGDVYVNEPKALKEGEEKHIISVFVADESGLINRVAGVFARRGANIESLAVGLTADKALFTIVVTGTSHTVSNLVKQLTKLVKVRYAENITQGDRIERETLLLKLQAPSGNDRVELMQLAQIFRARVVDVSDTTLTFCVSGDPGKCAAMVKVMSKFGVMELTRTGRVCLLRGTRTLEPPSVGAGLRSLCFQEQPAMADLSPQDFMDDVSDGVFQVDSVLDATYHPSVEFAAHTLTIDVRDVPGVLNQVTGVFARRGYNVESLAVGPSEKEGMSRIVMVVPGSQDAITKLTRQLEKLVWVEKVTDLTYAPFVNRELMLVKVKCTPAQRGELRDLASIFRADVLDVGPTTMTLEVLGKQDKMKALTDLLEPYGIREIARTGRIAQARSSGVDCKFLEQRQSQRVY